MLSGRLSHLFFFTMTTIAGVTLSSIEAATPPDQVGAAMALLSTLEDARVLPPEGTPEANNVIKIVIQFQSAFMKSTDSAIRDFFRHSLVRRFEEPRAGELDIAFHKSGWSSSVLEAFDTYYSSAPANEFKGLAAGFSQYNVTVGDFEYLLDLFRKAQLEYQQRGQDIHRIFAERRQMMPGTQS